MCIPCILSEKFPSDSHSHTVCFPIGYLVIGYLITEYLIIRYLAIGYLVVGYQVFVLAEVRLFVVTTHWSSHALFVFLLLEMPGAVKANERSGIGCFFVSSLFVCYFLLLTFIMLSILGHNIVAYWCQTKYIRHNISTISILVSFTHTRALTVSIKEILQPQEKVFDINKHRK